MTLAPEETATVLLTAPAQAFATVTENGQLVLQPRTVSVTVGDTERPATVRVQLTGEPVTLQSTIHELL